MSLALVMLLLADLTVGGLPHNHHKPRLAGYKLGGSV